MRSYTRYCLFMSLLQFRGRLSASSAKRNATARGGGGPRFGRVERCLAGVLPYLPTWRAVRRRGELREQLVVCWVPVRVLPGPSQPSRGGAPPLSSCRGRCGSVCRCVVVLCRGSSSMGFSVQIIRKVSAPDRYLCGCALCAYAMVWAV